MRNMESECVENHYHAEDENGVHCSVFQVFISFDALDVTYREFSQDESTDAVSNENQWN